MKQPTGKQIKDFLEVFDWLCEKEAFQRVRSYGLQRCNDVPGIDEKADKARPVLEWLMELCGEDDVQRHVRIERESWDED
jgi:hypothetical protein